MFSFLSSPLMDLVSVSSIEFSGSGRFEQTAAVDEVDALRRRLVVVNVGVVGVVGTTVGHSLGATQPGWVFLFLRPSFFIFLPRNNPIFYGIQLLE